MAIVKRPLSSVENTKSIEEFIRGAPDANTAAPAAVAPAQVAEKPAPKARLMKGNQAQITLTIPVDLLERAGDMARQLSITRAAFMKLAISRAVEAEEA